MSEQPLSDTDHVARYCRPATVPKGRLTAAAFFLRPASETRAEEKYLSVSWLEYFGDRDKEVAMKHVRSVVENNMDTTSNGRYAVMNVGEIIEFGASLQPPRQMKVLHLPMKDYCCHSGVFGYTAAEKGIAAKLSLLVKPEQILPGLNKEKE